MLLALLNWLKSVYRLFWQINIHHTLNFYPEQPRKESKIPRLNVSKLKSSKELTDLICILINPELEFGVGAMEVI